MSKQRRSVSRKAPNRSPNPGKATGVKGPSGTSPASNLSKQIAKAVDTIR